MTYFELIDQEEVDILIEDITDIAVEFADTHQLKERMARPIRNFVTKTKRRETDKCMFCTY